MPVRRKQRASGRPGPVSARSSPAVRAADRRGSESQLFNGLRAAVGGASSIRHSLAEDEEEARRYECVEVLLDVAERFLRERYDHGLLKLAEFAETELEAGLQIRSERIRTSRPRFAESLRRYVESCARGRYTEGDYVAGILEWLVRHGTPFELRVLLEGWNKDDLELTPLPDMPEVREAVKRVKRYLSNIGAASAPDAEAIITHTLIGLGYPERQARSIFDFESQRAKRSEVAPVKRVPTRQ